MKIAKSTAQYEAWLARHLRLIPEDLAYKHDQMASAPFPFLRATYYRWAQIWADVCPAAARAPEVLAVGDLHIENFGTWRDGEGRLIWGINDFDEAWRLPYTSDLIRLTASALLGSACSPKEVAATILKGYTESVEAGGLPFTLAERHPVLRAMATARLHDPGPFWDKLRVLPEISSEMPAGALKAMAHTMPESGLHWHVGHRRAGVGSLGRQRYVGLVEWRGGLVAREAKALAPSAAFWAAEGKGTAPILYEEILDKAIRCRDPFVHMSKRWIVRRLAPDCSRSELSALPKERDELRLLKDMGFETANIHLGSIAPRHILGDLKKRKSGWLLSAARDMEKAVIADFNSYSAK